MLRMDLVILDELDYLPLSQAGCGLLGRFVGNEAVRVDSNLIEDSMRPWPRAARCGRARAASWGGQRAEMVMSLVLSAKLDDHDTWGHLKNVAERLMFNLKFRASNQGAAQASPCRASRI